MTTTDANSWDASMILRNMTEEERGRLKGQIALNKLAYSILGRRYNRRLCAFVEKKLNGVSDG